MDFFVRAWFASAEGANERSGDDDGAGGGRSVADKLTTGNWFHKSGRLMSTGQTYGVTPLKKGLKSRYHL
ncbi:MAG: hypothetical protein MUF81_20705 [Verrucomicrobia bacterium]|jgi:hypothetical protein|nr:hypothetical protein [Verrucomicrobiota bacterium]